LNVNRSNEDGGRDSTLSNIFAGFSSYLGAASFGASFFFSSFFSSIKPTGFKALSHNLIFP